jgi:hypothetical protein
VSSVEQELKSNAVIASPNNRLFFIVSKFIFSFSYLKFIF